VVDGSGDYTYTPNRDLGYDSYTFIAYDATDSNQSNRPSDATTLSFTISDAPQPTVSLSISRVEQWWPMLTVC
jgi:hypothetical protein